MSFTIATTVEEALAAVAAGARPIAGGTDLVVGARHGKAALPADLVAIDRIAALREVLIEVAGLTLGAGVSHHTIETAGVGATWSAWPTAALVGSPSTATSARSAATS
jgi:CO/xanthine dehydrogenase FAD-binding subunit